MSRATTNRRCTAALLPLHLVALTACGAEAPIDPNNREIPWDYGPRTSESTREHLHGTGTKWGTAIAKGWQCRLLNGNELVVQSFELATSHPLFDKVVLSVGLFDHQAKSLARLRSAPLTAQSTRLTFAVEPAIGQQLADLVFYYVAVD